MKDRMILVAVAMVVATGLLAGCGGGGAVAPPADPPSGGIYAMTAAEAYIGGRTFEVGADGIFILPLRGYAGDDNEIRIRLAPDPGIGVPQYWALQKSVGGTWVDDIKGRFLSGVNLHKEDGWLRLGRWRLVVRVGASDAPISWQVIKVVESIPIKPA